MVQHKHLASHIVWVLSVLGEIGKKATVDLVAAVTVAIGSTTEAVAMTIAIVVDLTTEIGLTTVTVAAMTTVIEVFCC